MTVGFIRGFGKFCGNVQQPVCDLFRIDAQMELQIPVTEQLFGLKRIDAGLEDTMLDDELERHLSELFRELLKGELQVVKSAEDRRRNELTRQISERERALACESELEDTFGKYIAGLPAEQRPNSNPQVWRMFAGWEEKFKTELEELKRKFTELENRPVDKEAIFTSSRNKALHLLQRAAHAEDLWPGCPADGPPNKTNGPQKQGPRGNENLRDYLIPVIKLIKNGTGHTDAFRIVAEKLKVENTTVASQCTRMLGLNTPQFIESVRSGRIIQVLKNKYTHQGEIELINLELVPLYL